MSAREQGTEYDKTRIEDEAVVISKMEKLC